MSTGEKRGEQRAGNTTYLIESGCAQHFTHSTARNKTALSSLQSLNTPHLFNKLYASTLRSLEVRSMLTVLTY
jgi:hypothetical protein